MSCRRYSPRISLLHLEWKGQGAEKETLRNGLYSATLGLRGHVLFKIPVAGLECARVRVRPRVQGAARQP